MLTRLRIFVLLTAATTSANGQLRLPALPLPALPLPALTQTIGQTDAGSLDHLSDLRHLAISHLIRDNRRVVEADPNGEPIVRGEILALSPADDALGRARAAGFLVVREQTLAPADLHVVVLRLPTGLSTRQALQKLRDSDPQGTYDYNHIYTGSGDRDEAAVTASPQASTQASPQTPSPAASMARPNIRVGLLDTGIEVSHAVFHGSTVRTWGCSDKPVPALHGTAVASLLLTQANADLFAADVYCGLPTGGAVDSIIGALAWMTRERVPVINISLVGPKNALLEKTVAALLAEGYIVVAAVGNDGPTAPPLYPAAYPNVVGVTGVDAKHRVLIEALRGPQVMFAARGADLKAANTEHGFTAVRGTSFAAPAVAGLLAELMAAPDKGAADAAVDSLAKRAIDLGPPGRDLTYGFGFVSDGGL